MKRFITSLTVLSIILLIASNALAMIPAPTMTVTTSGLSVTVSWSSVRGATGYRLYYAPYPAGAPIGNIDMGSATSLSATLPAGSSYFVAIKAYDSSESSGYSNIEHFTIAGGSTVTDIDGNVYNTVTIGSQVWMKENLKVTKYRNGETIPTTASDIVSATSPKYQWAYNGNESNVSTYGRLYTWYAATDSRGLCPTGWHLPTYSEWTTLVDFLGGVGVAGGKMKETGTTHWLIFNTDADNSSGFTALPGGGRSFNGSLYLDVGFSGFWWSATESNINATNAWYHSLYYYGGDVVRSNTNKSFGFSVRCVRD